MKYLVQSVTKSETKSKKQYLRLKLLEEGGRSWPAVWWDAGSTEVAPGQFLDALTEESSYNGESQLTVKAARVVGQATDDSFLPRTPYSIDGLKTELEGFVASVQDPDLRAILEHVVKDPRWLKSPAATDMHHAYVGGLLEHTVNLCRIVDKVCLLYPEVRRDLLLTGAVLHDVGKMDEIVVSTVLEYSPVGNLLGHISIGFQRVGRIMDALKTPGFNEFGASTGKRLLVEHLILAHHGQQAYGSPKEPQLLEAQLLVHVDGIDASMGAMRAALAKTKADAVWSEGIGKYNKQRLWLGEKT